MTTQALSLTDNDQGASSTDAPRDGRRMRAERGREAVVEALLALYEEDVLRPSGTVIAQRAGVSERSVFRYFKDLDALIQAGIALRFSTIGHLFAPPDTSGTTQARIAALVEQRLAIYEATNKTTRAASLVLGESKRVSEAFDFRRQILGEQIDTTFAVELRDKESDAARELSAALDAVASLENIEYLRHHSRLSRLATSAILTRSLAALLDAAEPRS